MTKADLISRVAEDTGLTKKCADEAINSVFEAISDALKAGDKVQLIGFGTFAVKDRSERTAINPATKEKINVPATRVPSFKAGKALKELVAK